MIMGSRYAGGSSAETDPMLTSTVYSYTPDSLPTSASKLCTTPVPFGGSGAVPSNGQSGLVAWPCMGSL